MVLFVLCIDDLEKSITSKSYIYCRHNSFKKLHGTPCLDYFVAADCWINFQLFPLCYLCELCFKSDDLCYRGDEEYLYVNGVGIKSGDFFQFYRSDTDAALKSIGCVSLDLKNLKFNEGRKNGDQEVFGGFIFSCYGRGDAFFTQDNVDSSPFVENLPGVPFAGIFCGGEIGRGSSSLTEEGRKDNISSCCLHVYSTVYLVMSYT